MEAIESNMNISEAQLRGHLVNDQVKDANGQPATPAPGATPVAPNPSAELTSAQDYQLSRALDLIRALSIYGSTMAPQQAAAAAVAAAPASEKPADKPADKPASAPASKP